MQCDFEQINETQWRCRRCGKMQLAGTRADGTVIPPRWDLLPPCGWQPLHIELGGHYWIETYRADGQRHWHCGRCRIRVALPDQTTDEEAKATLAQQPACQAPPTPPPQQGVGKPGDAPDQPPGLLQRAWNYSKALARWIAEGRPTRPPAEIQRILAICRACPKYDPKEEICRLCGCRTNETRQAWRNKLAMATEACPLCKWGCKLTPEQLKTFVERVYVINLKTRPDRLKTFLDRLDRFGWPFPDPIIYPAIDGNKVGVPPEFTQGGGAYGCRMSHLRILQDCLMDDVKTVLILEDDAEITEGFTDRVAEFLAKVPKDWEGIMLGGQHHAPPKETGIPGVVRVQYAQRTHAYIARPTYMKALQQRWGNCTVHIDWAMKDWQHKRIVYAPDPWLIGQAGGRSDIRGAVKPREWWSSAVPPDSSAGLMPLGPKPVILLRASRPVAEQLQRFGWHGGYSRDRATGFDNGLKNIVREPKQDRPRHLRDWIAMIQREAEDAHALCTIWHPEISLQDIQAAYSGPILEIQVEQAESIEAAVESAFAQLPAQWREYLEANPAPNQPPVVLLNAPDEVAEELQDRHRWLCARLPEPLPEPDQLHRWVARLRRQAAQEGRVLALYGQSVFELPPLKIPTEPITAHAAEEAIGQFFSTGWDDLTKYTLTLDAIAEWHLTYRCNLKCVACNRLCFLPKPLPIPDMTLRDAEKFIKEADQLGWKPIIRILGGEPTLHPQIEDFARLAASYVPGKVELWSNLYTPEARQIADRLEEEGVWKVFRPTAKRGSVVHSLQHYWIAPSDVGKRRKRPCSQHASFKRCGISVDHLGYTQCPCGGAIDSVMRLNARTTCLADLWNPQWTEQHIKKLCGICGAELDCAIQHLPIAYGVRMSKTWEQKIKAL